jgi:hypothetical protein
MNLVKRAKNIILTPAKEWEVIKGENLTIADIFTKYAMILAAIPAVAGFIGYSLIGVSYGFGTFRVPVGTALVWAILQYILSLAGIFIVAFIMDALAPTFGCAKNMVAAVKIVAFSYTAAWVAGVFNIIPALGILVGIASLYSLYLLYLGMKIVKEVPADKLVGYFVVTLIATVVVYFVVGMIVGAIAFGNMSALGGIRTF